MMVPDAANGRIQHLLNRPITLDGGPYKIPTTVREILSSLSSSLNKPTLTLYGSSVPYLVDGDYCLSRLCLPENQIGGYRTKPQDFDFSLTDPDADNKKRDIALNHFSFWLQGKLSASDDPRMLLKLFVPSRWNSQNTVHPNTFLFLSLKDTLGRRYDIRIVQQLKLPYLFSIERIQVIYDLTHKTVSLSTDEAATKECLVHWNQEIARMHRIELMDPLAWIKMVQKMGRGIYFDPDEVKKLSERAQDPALWVDRKIDSLKSLIEKGLDEADYFKTIHYLFHVTRILQKIIFRPDTLTRYALYNWIIRNAFVNIASFNRALAQISFFASWAAFKHPEGLKGFFCKRFHQEVRIRLGDKRNDPSFFVPFSASCPDPKDDSLGAIFGYEEDPVVLRQLQEIELNETPNEAYFKTFERYNWAYNTVPEEVIDRLIRLNEMAYLTRYYAAVRGTNLGTQLLVKLQAVSFKKELFTELSSPYKPEELTFLAHHYRADTAAAINTLIPLHRLLSHLNPSYDSAERFLASLHQPTGQCFTYVHQPVYNDDPPFSRTYLNKDQPELMECFYRRWIHETAFKSLDDQLATLLALSRLYPTHPEWLKCEVIAHITSDIAHDTLYFYHWYRAAPILQSCLSASDIQRESLCNRLLERNQPRHIIHLFALLMDGSKKMNIEPYFKNGVSAFYKYSVDDNTLNYLFEGALGVLEILLETKKSTRYFDMLWNELVKRTNACVRVTSLHTFTVLKFRYFNAFYKNFKNTDKLSAYLNEIINTLDRIYTDLSAEELEILVATLRRVRTIEGLVISPSCLDKIKKFEFQLKVKSNPPCAII